MGLGNSKRKNIHVGRAETELDHTIYHDTKGSLNMDHRSRGKASGKVAEQTADRIQKGDIIRRAYCRTGSDTWMDLVRQIDHISSSDASEST